MSDFLRITNLISDKISRSTSREVHLEIPPTALGQKSDFGVSVAQWLKQAHPHVKVVCNAA